jgi:predicted 2-oxoglutarate/Fe(II)-dependent dioxygenase YbiX
MSSPLLHPLPGRAETCLLIPGFLSPQECRDIIALTESRGFCRADTDYPPSYRNNDRLVLDDAEWAARLLQRLQRHAPSELQAAGSGNPERWELEGINERLRFCRYRPGQRFSLHQDGVHYRRPTVQSRLTFMIYLTDGEAFEGGDTVFYSAGPGGEEDGTPPRVIGRVRPRAGSLILFDHSLWHAGDTVTAGIKHVLRSDVLYRRQESEMPAIEAAHRGYIWTLAALAGGGFASAGRDGTIRLWDGTRRPAGTLLGHTQSVLGLAAIGHARLASVSRDRSLRWWHLPSGRCERTIQAHDAAVLAVEPLADGMLATASADASIKLWHDDGTAAAVLAGHRGWVWSLAQAGQLLASASEDGEVRLWDAAASRCLHTLPGSTPLRALAAAPNGRWLASGDIEGAIALWLAAPNGWQLAGRWTAHAAAVRRLRLLPPGLLASTGEDGRVRLWQLAMLQPFPARLRAESRHGNFATDVVALRDGYASAGYDGCLLHHPWPSDSPS